MSRTETLARLAGCVGLVTMMIVGCDGSKQVPQTGNSTWTAIPTTEGGNICPPPTPDMWNPGRSNQAASRWATSEANLSQTPGSLCFPTMTIIPISTMTREVAEVKIPTIDRTRYVPYDPTRSPQLTMEKFRECERRVNSPLPCFMDPDFILNNP